MENRVRVRFYLLRWWGSGRFVWWKEGWLFFAPVYGGMEVVKRFYWDNHRA